MVEAAPSGLVLLAAGGQRAEPESRLLVLPVEMVALDRRSVDAFKTLGKAELGERRNTSRLKQLPDDPVRFL
jgi:hypothetical protein